MGMPTPHVEPSPSRIRTCTGFPDGGEGEADGPVDATAEVAPPACQVAPGDDPPQAAERASVTPSTAAVSADRHEPERLMTATMLRTRRIHQVARTVRTRSPPTDRHDRRTPVMRWPSPRQPDRPPIPLRQLREHALPQDAERQPQREDRRPATPGTAGHVADEEPAA